MMYKQSTRSQHKQEQLNNRGNIGESSVLNSITSMQRKVGNQAVMQLLRNSFASPDQGNRTSSTTPAIQRKLLEYVPEKYDPLAVQSLNPTELDELAKLINNARSTASEIDGYVTDGRENVQKVIDEVIAGSLKLDEVAKQFSYSGHAQNFQNKLIDFMAGQYSIHPAAPGGYLIEDYASSKMGGGVGIQVTPSNLRGSRPDFTIPLADNNSGPGGRNYDGLVDATSGSPSSIGHILRKGGGAWVKRTAYPYVAESIYDPLSINSVNRQLSDDEIEAIKSRQIEKQQAEDNAKAAKIGALKDQFEDTINTILSIVNTGEEGTHLDKILKLSKSRTESRLSLIGIAYKAVANEISSTTSFEDWSSDDFIDFFGKKASTYEKTNALLEIIKVLP